MHNTLHATRRHLTDRGSFGLTSPPMTTGMCITHRNKDLLIKVPARWRELQARGSTLMRMEVKAVEEPVWLIANAVRWWVFLVPLCLDGARYTPQTDLQGAARYGSPGSPWRVPNGQRYRRV
jgi:hypothetical protein